MGLGGGFEQWKARLNVIAVLVKGHIVMNVKEGRPRYKASEESEGCIQGEGHKRKLHFPQQFSQLWSREAFRFCMGKRERHLLVD
jgi:hypothetical protein